MGEVVGEPVEEIETVGVPLDVTETVGEPVLETVGEEEPEADLEGDTVGVPLADTETVGVPLADTETVGDPLDVGLADGEDTVVQPLGVLSLYDTGVSLFTRLYPEAHEEQSVIGLLSPASDVYPTGHARHAPPATYCPARQLVASVRMNIAVSRKNVMPYWPFMLAIIL